MMNPPGAGLISHVFLWLLKFLKPVAIVAVLVYLQINFPRTWLANLGLRRLEQFVKKIAAQKNLCVFLVGLSLFVVRGTCVLISGVPQPRYHDEFSYLLAADTFAHGRLTNPPQPMWVHFETFHEIWQPTYMSMYPPGQGLILALGQALGNPWIGQLLAASLMCGGICWMLQGWIPPRWALLGGVLVVARLGLLGYWTNGYWCACLPAFGGALVLGALPRMQHHTRSRDAAIMAIGLAVLANSRPYEGFLLSLGVAIALFAWMFSKSGPLPRVSLAKIVLPLVLTLAPLSIWTGFYYYRVTGSPFRMTYDVNRARYAMGRYFIWQSAWPQKTYDHAKMQAQYERELREATQYKTLRGFLHSGRNKLHYFWQDLLIPPLPFVLIALPWAARDRRLRVPWLIGGIFVIGLAFEVWFLPHYFAPATALLYLILMQCMRHLCWFRWREKPAGLAFVRAVCAVYVATVVVRIVLAAVHVHPEREWQHGDAGRESVVRRLDAIPGQHVVLVRYAPDFDPDREWVFNKSDIDDSKIIWARDMGPEKNQELLSYYRGRQFWLVEADGSPQLEPYSGQQEKSGWNYFDSSVTATLCRHIALLRHAARVESVQGFQAAVFTADSENGDHMAEQPNATTEERRRPDPNEKLVKVFDSEEESEALVVKGLLDSAGIDNDLASASLLQDAFPGLGGMIILVREEDAEKARSLIAESKQEPSAGDLVDQDDDDATEELPAKG